MSPKMSYDTWYSSAFQKKRNHEQNLRLSPRKSTVHLFKKLLLNESAIIYFKSIQIFGQCAGFAATTDVFNQEWNLDVGYNNNMILKLTPNSNYLGVKMKKDASAVADEPTNDYPNAISEIEMVC